jgi:predicted aminopeptidase
MKLCRSIGRTLLGFGLFLCCACDIGYYGHLVQGQGKIFWARTSVADYTSTTAISPDLRAQFDLADSILVFAKTMGLNTGDSYQSFYDTKGEPISWNISASSPTSFTPYLWHFPLVGALPYKGFFSRQRAERAYQELVDDGYDAILRPVSAYSTLGYFSDPLLSTMLDAPPDELANLILHELTHSTIFAEDNTDFNESLATFVGQKGSLLFLAHHFGPHTKHIVAAEHKRADAERFRDYMTSVVAALDSLYTQDLSKPEILAKREQIFAQAQEDFQPTLAYYHNPNYNFFLKWTINNARLLSYRRYNSRLYLFEAIYQQRQESMGEALAVFSICSKDDNPWQCLENSGKD